MELPGNISHAGEQYNRGSHLSMLSIIRLILSLAGRYGIVVHTMGTSGFCGGDEVLVLFPDFFYALESASTLSAI